MAKIFINQQLAQVHDAHYLNFHGHSVFTTLRSKNGELLWWPQHWQRVTEHARFFGFLIPDEKEIYSLLVSEIKKASVDQTIRLVFTKNSSALILSTYESLPRSIYDGVKVIITTIKIHPQLGEFKTGNSLPYFLARNEAEKNGAFEGLLVDNNNFVVDGSRTSLMLFTNDRLIALSGGLRGIMREQALAFAKSEGVRVERAFLRREDLDGELLLANSLMGVVPVGGIRSEFVRKLVEKFRD